MQMRLNRRFDKDTLTLFVLMGENTQPNMMQFKIFSPPLLRMLGSMFCACFLDTISLVITMMNGYCAYSKWNSHIGKHNHY
jgi:hypothetical protein